MCMVKAIGGPHACMVKLVGISHYVKTLEHNIIQIHNKYFLIFSTFGLNVENIRKYYVESCQSYRTLLWI